MNDKAPVSESLTVKLINSKSSDLYKAFVYNIDM